MRPGDEIRLVKENLAFAVSIWNGAKVGRVPPGALAGSGNDGPLSTNRVGAQPQTRHELAAELTRGAANQMRGAFALSALQSQRSLEEAFSGEPIQEEWPELRAARSAMLLIGRAVQRSILEPVWECPPEYRRVFHIRRLGFTLNASALEGQVLSWDDFGGLERYLLLLEYCASSANAAAAAGATRTLPRVLSPSQTGPSGVLGAPHALTAGAEDTPSAVPPRGYPGDPPDRRLAPDAPPFLPPPVPVPQGDEEDSWDNVLAERAGQWHTQPTEQKPEAPRNGQNGQMPDGVASAKGNGVSVGNMVSQFVAERCETGEDRRMLAGELYEGFLGWCRDSGWQPVSQRTFGMRLTGLGLRRKRRGHGRHWWEGIRLADA